MNVNGIDIDAGLIVDGDVEGQYTIDKLADIAVGLGLELDDSTDPRIWRGAIRDALESGGEGLYESEQLSATEDALVDKLNAATTNGWFEWRDGSVWLIDGDRYEDEMEDDDDEEG